MSGFCMHVRNVFTLQNEWFLYAYKKRIHITGMSGFCMHHKKRIHITE